MKKKELKKPENIVIKLLKGTYKSGIDVAQYKGVIDKKIGFKQSEIIKEEPKMKKLITGMAVMVAVVGMTLVGTPQEAKADSRTLHGVADIIFATGALVNGGYSTTVYYEPAPVYYAPVYRPVRFYDHGYYRHGYRHHHGYYRCY